MRYIFRRRRVLTLTKTMSNGSNGRDTKKEINTGGIGTTKMTLKWKT
jgi:hypothetical protein